MKTRIIIENEYTPEELVQAWNSGAAEYMRFWQKLADPTGMFHAAAPNVTATVPAPAPSPVEEPPTETPAASTSPVAFMEMAMLPSKMVAAFWAPFIRGPRG